jgi:hypothetical protein
MLEKVLKSPNPALNVYHSNEADAFDIFYSDVTAVYDGATSVIIFVGLLPFAALINKVSEKLTHR